MIAQGAAPPASGASVKVPLESNLFKKGHSMFDNSLFTEFETFWGKGPLIPVFAKVWVKDSADKDVLAPKALGKVKFLWDWESKLVAGAVAFVNSAQDYEKSTTKPKGENCHKKRGGKRGKGATLCSPPKRDTRRSPRWTPTSFRSRLRNVRSREPGPPTVMRGTMARWRVKPVSCFSRPAWPGTPTSYRYTLRRMSRKRRLSS